MSNCNEFDVSSGEEEALLEIIGEKRSRALSKGSDYPPTKQSKNNHGKLDATVDLAQRVLKDKFGLRSFRLEQEAVIKRLLTGKSAVVVFPTGGGKSLCYQVPALAIPELDLQNGASKSANPGISLVISPLLALMKDQIDALRTRGINAGSIDSGQTRDRYRAIMGSIKNGQLRLLYCAPERLNNEIFLETMYAVRGGIRMVAIDEAHCISEWGHAFRPEYLKIARFVSEVKAERVVCLTATATPKVAEDICRRFGIAKEGLFRTPSYRSNLHLKCRVMTSEAEKFHTMCTFLQTHTGATIVYVTLQKQSEMLAKDLRSKGFNAQAYHAGMNTDERTTIQDDFTKSSDLIICATIAFGMGIDKADIRSVIHFDLPSSIEEYSQQIGRAGRDGSDSICQLYLCNEDFYLRENFIYGDLPSPGATARLLDEIFSPDHAALQVGETFMVNQNEQSNEFDIRVSTVNMIYAHLDIYFELLRPTTPQYSKYTYELKAETAVTSDSSPSAKAIRENARKAVKYHHIDVTATSSNSGISRAELVTKLRDWNDGGLIDLKVSGVQQVYRVEQKLPTSKIRKAEIVNQLYSRMQEREKQDLIRLQEVVSLMTAKECLPKVLAAYFNDEGTESGVPIACGHCTWCETRKPVVLPPRKKFSVDQSRIQQVLDACSVRDDPRFLARAAFGINGPRATKMKLKSNPVFGSMMDHSFLQLLEAFEKACQTEHIVSNHTGKPSRPPKASTNGRGSKALRPSPWAHGV